MCHVSLDDHYLFSAVSYIQLLCMSFISNYSLIHLFKWKNAYIHGPSLLWAEFVMGRVCYGPRCPGTEEGYHLTPSNIFKDCKECVRIKAVP